jgi:hypothetical protein
MPRPPGGTQQRALCRFCLNFFRRSDGLEQAVEVGMCVTRLCIMLSGSGVGEGIWMGENTTRLKKN